MGTPIAKISQPVNQGYSTKSPVKNKQQSIFSQKDGHLQITLPQVIKKTLLFQSLCHWHSLWSFSKEEGRCDFTDLCPLLLEVEKNKWSLCSKLSGGEADLLSCSYRKSQEGRVKSSSTVVWNLKGDYKGLPKAISKHFQHPPLPYSKRVAKKRVWHWKRSAVVLKE